MTGESVVMVVGVIVVTSGTAEVDVTDLKETGGKVLILGAPVPGVVVVPHAVKSNIGKSSLRLILQLLQSFLRRGKGFSDRHDRRNKNRAAPNAPPRTTNHACRKVSSGISIRSPKGPEPIHQVS